jgi:hypothetical protein
MKSQHALPASAANRVILNVPFEEKEAAKRHGARWDPISRVWWIARQDIGANLDIWPWIVDKDLQFTTMGAWDWARDDDYEEQPHPAAASPRKAPSRTQAVLAAKSEWEAASAAAAAAASPPPPLHPLPPPCDCLVPPWEHCIHTHPALDDAASLAADQRTDDESLALPSGRSAKVIDNINQWR